MLKWWTTFLRLPPWHRRFFLSGATLALAGLTVWLLAGPGGQDAAATAGAATTGAAVAPTGRPGSSAAAPAAEATAPVAPSPPAQTEAWLVRVNGRPIIGLPSEQDAKAVLDELLAQYTAQWASDGEQVETFGFREQVDTAFGEIAVDRVRNREEAKRILLRGTDRILNYTVQRGDTMWDIAAEQGMDLEALELANPGVDPEALQIGQELSLIVAEPFVHSTATVRHTYVANIAFATEERTSAELYPWESAYEKRGVYGRQRVTELLTYDGDEIVDRKTLEVERLSEPETAIYVRGTKTAPMLGSGQFIVPLKGATFTSGFGPRWGSHHNGIDLAAPAGTPVYAADSGTVVAAGWQGGLGYAVRIDHGAGQYVTVYGHFSSYVASVGDQVSQGDLIGYVGSTGFSTGPHLHFEVHVDGSPQNPLHFFPE